MASSTRELDGRVALVTGAGGRIGRAICSAVAREGARLVASDVNEAALGETHSLLGEEHATLVADLADHREAERVVHETIERLGRLDVLVNNAAVLTPGGTVLDCDPELFDLTMAVNVKAPFFAIRAAMPHMLERGQGSVVNIASVLGLVGMRGFSSYATSKGAVVQLTRQVAVDFGDRGIRCNAVCPGTIVRPGELEGLDPELAQEVLDAHPVGRAGCPEEIGEVVAFLASDRASFMNGSIVTVDGGFTSR